jgi:hypothetical protein
LSSLRGCNDVVSLALNFYLSAARVARHLGLCTSDLKKRYPDSAAASAKRQCEPFVSFVDVTPTTPWLTLAVEVDLKLSLPPSPLTFEKESIGSPL